jgi:hypothetical protein
LNLLGGASMVRPSAPRNIDHYLGSEHPGGLFIFKIATPKHGHRPYRGGWPKDQVKFKNRKHPLWIVSFRCRTPDTSAEVRLST